MKRNTLWISLLCAVVACQLMVAGPAFAWGKKEAVTEAIAVKFAGEGVRGDYGVVSTVELNQWLKDGKKMLIVDTMPYEASYVKKHIPTALVERAWIRCGSCLYYSRRRVVKFGTRHLADYR